MSTTRHAIAYLALLCLLGASLAGNYFLFQKAREFYAREAQVRMEPVSERFAKKNAEIRAQPKTKIRMVMFGESRCAMWSVRTPKNWGNLEIINRGIGGETTPQIIRRLQDDVLSLNPDVVLLQMGDNDLKTMAVLPGTRDKAIEQTYANIIAIAQALSDHDIEVIITTIFPPGPTELLRKPLWSPEVNEAIDLVNARLLAFEYPRVTPVDCDAILRQGAYIQPAYSLDTLHLTPLGYEALNRELEPLVRPIAARAALRNLAR